MTRLAQVDVHIYEAGRDYQPGGVKDFASFGHAVAVTGKSYYATVFNQKILTGVRSLRGVDDVAVLN